MFLPFRPSPTLLRWAGGLAIVSLIGAMTSLASDEQRPVRRDMLVAAAASLSVVAPSLTQAFHDATGIDVRFNFAGSNTLARQIVEGARVDAFISADERQMDIVERAGRVVEGTRRAFISNRLVVVAAGPALSSRVTRPDDLARAAVRRVAMGDPAAVPAGVYGRRWLEAIGLWGAVQPKVVPLPSSPSVLAAVEAGRADAGIVYTSDVKPRSLDAAHVAYIVPLDAAPRITYPAAAIIGGRIADARRFLAFLEGETAQRVFQAAGFYALGAR